MTQRPAANADRTVPKDRTEHIAAPSGEAYSKGAAKTVLVVDDNASNRLLLKRLVAALGHVTILAEDGYEGIEKARSSSPDVILMDIVMPGMDGVEAMQKIRELGSKAVIYACSAEVDAWGTSSFEEVGFEGFLKKPIDIRDLSILLRTGSLLEAS